MILNHLITHFFQHIDDFEGNVFVQVIVILQTEFSVAIITAFRTRRGEREMKRRECVDR